MFQLANDSWVIDLRSERQKRLSKRKRKNKLFSKFEVIPQEISSGIKWKIVQVPPAYKRRIRKSVGRRRLLKI